MKPFVRTMLIGYLSVFFITGCASYQGVLDVAKLPESSFKSLQPRNCTIDVAPVVFNTDEQLNPKNISKIKAMVPLVLIYYWKEQYPSITPQELLAADPGRDMQKVIADSLDNSHLFSGKGATYTLETEVLNFYSMSFVNGVGFMILLGGVVTSSEVSFPVGYVSMKFTLKDEYGRRLGSSIISRSYLFGTQIYDDPRYSDLVQGGLRVTKGNSVSMQPFTRHTPMSREQGNPELKPTKIMCAYLALRSVLEELPSFVESLLGDEVPLDSQKRPREFSVIRLTKEYNFMQEVVLEYETGSIIESGMVARRSMIFSRPDEWVVSRVQGGHYLSDGEYAALLAYLRKRYRVEYDGNLTAAKFLGKL